MERLKLTAGLVEVYVDNVEGGTKYPGFGEYLG